MQSIYTWIKLHNELRGVYISKTDKGNISMVYCMVDSIVPGMTKGLLSEIHKYVPTVSNISVSVDRPPMSDGWEKIK